MPHFFNEWYSDPAVNPTTIHSSKPWYAEGLTARITPPADKPTETVKLPWFKIPVGHIAAEDGLKWVHGSRPFPIGTEFYARTPNEQGDEGLAEAASPQDSMQTQVGGTHYLMCAIQPFEYSMANKLDAMQHTIIKYVTRFRNKAGIEDLMKARDAIDKLIQWENTHATKES